MADSSGPTRRAFLGAALATGAGVAVLNSDGGPSRLEWCMRPVHPMASKAIHLVRGGLPDGASAELELWIDGPAFDEPALMLQRAVRLDGDHATWELELPYAHPQLVAGEYAYTVVARVGSATLKSAPVTYQVRPFNFGA